MNDELRQLVWDRAASTCEYCRVPQFFDPLPFGVDHIHPQYHHGPTVAENLCLCCFHDNTFKAVNVAGYDPVTSRCCQSCSIPGEMPGMSISKSREVASSGRRNRAHDV